MRVEYKGWSFGQLTHTNRACVYASQVLEVPVEYDAVDRVIEKAAVDRADIALVIHVGVGRPGAIALEQ